MEQGHIEPISKLFTMAKELGGKIYVCVSSMTLLNIARDELIDEVDESAGVPNFLMNTEDDQILFI